MSSVQRSYRYFTRDIDEDGCIKEYTDACVLLWDIAEACFQITVTLCRIRSMGCEEFLYSLRILRSTYKSGWDLLIHELIIHHHEHLLQRIFTFTELIKTLNLSDHLLIAIGCLNYSAITLLLPYYQGSKGDVLDMIYNTSLPLQWKCLLYQKCTNNFRATDTLLNQRIAMDISDTNTIENKENECLFSNIKH